MNAVRRKKIIDLMGVEGISAKEAYEATKGIKGYRKPKK